MPRPKVFHLLVRRRRNNEARARVDDSSNKAAETAAPEQAGGDEPKEKRRSSGLEKRRSSLIKLASIVIRPRSSHVNVANLVDLADEDTPSDVKTAAKLKVEHKVEAGYHHKTFQTLRGSLSSRDFVVHEVSNESSTSDTNDDPIAMVYSNLPPDPLLLTPFGSRRCTYADYTASGRSLWCIEEYIQRVINPMYANTHTETSATGLQMTHAREESRAIIMEALHADPKQYDLIFTGTGSTGAIWKLIALLGIHCPAQLKKFLPLDQVNPPLILISHCEHHSNELMWRETVADVIPIPPDETGSLDLACLRRVLEENKGKYDCIIGSFSAGSNVTGLTTPPGPVASLMHEYGGYACFDYAGAGPYVEMRMDPNIPEDDKSYLDAIFISPHKFVGGPGTPGILCVKKDFADCRGAIEAPPTISGGGTVALVWPGEIDEFAGTNRIYEQNLHVREEAGTPGIVESIRCGLAFHVRNLVGIDRIESIEGTYARKAVEKMQQKKIWVMGDNFTNITSESRLSITSFNVWCAIPGISPPENQETLNGVSIPPPDNTFRHPTSGKPLMLHFNFVAALLNDVYGIQSRSGCSCAGPLAFRLFDRFDFMTKDAINEAKRLADEEYHGLKPGWCRVNFNYFIPQSEFDFMMAAIEQIAEHGWKLLPLYALCLKTGQYWYNGVKEDAQGNLVSFNRFDAVRCLKEVVVDSRGAVTWSEVPKSLEDRQKYLDQAMQIYDDAPALVRKTLFRFRDLRRKDVHFPDNLQKYRFFVLGSEVLPHLGISVKEIEAARNSLLSKDPEKNPRITSFPKHNTANPMYTFDRPRG